MTGQPRLLSHKQKRAARLLAAGHTQARVAARVGCGDRTIREWFEKRPDFRALVESEREAMRDPSVLDTLRDLLNDDNPRIRLGAAQELNRMRVSANDPDALPGQSESGPVIVNVNPWAADPDEPDDEPEQPDEPEPDAGVPGPNASRP